MWPLFLEAMEGYKWRSGDIIGYHFTLKGGPTLRYVCNTYYNYLPCTSHNSFLPLILSSLEYIVSISTIQFKELNVLHTFSIKKKVVGVFYETD